MGTSLGGTTRGILGGFPGRVLSIDAQKNDVKLQKMVQLVGNGDKTNYSIKRDVDLYYKNIL